MSTLLDFTPSTLAAFQFQPTLAGQLYAVTVTWNVFDQRYYINLSDLSGNLILCRGISASGPVLEAGLGWANGVATATTTVPHNVPVGTLVDAVIAQTNSGFDGEVMALATDAITLTYPLLTDPNQAVPLTGTVGFPLNLLDGYGLGTLLFHEDTQQFEY